MAIAGVAIFGNIFGSLFIPSTPLDFEYDIDDVESFTIHTKVENLNNKANGLIRQTDILYFQTEITSKHSEPARISYQPILSYAGENSHWGDQHAILIQPNETKSFNTQISIPNSGINLIRLHFELHEDRGPFSKSNIGKTSSSFIDERDVRFYYRILTESEYNAQIEKGLVYQLLWLSVAPIIILGVKALRDIIEYR